MGWLAIGLLAWLGGWAINIRLAALPKSRLTGLAIPVIFGLSLVVIWESMVRGFDVSPILSVSYTHLTLPTKRIV